jgi:hypothetical protein
MGRGSDAKVTEPYLVVGSEQDVLWLDIAMDQSLIVGMLQGRGNRTDIGDDALQGQARAFGVSLTQRAVGSICDLSEFLSFRQNQNVGSRLASFLSA